MTEREQGALNAAMRTAPTGIGGSADVAYGFGAARDFYRKVLKANNATLLTIGGMDLSERERADVLRLQFEANRCILGRDKEMTA